MKTWRSPTSPSPSFASFARSWRASRGCATSARPLSAVTHAWEQVKRSARIVSARMLVSDHYRTTSMQSTKEFRSTAPSARSILLRCATNSITTRKSAEAYASTLAMLQRAKALSILPGTTQESSFWRSTG